MSAARIVQLSNEGSLFIDLTRERLCLVAAWSSINIVRGR